MSFDVREADDVVLAAATEPQLRFASPSGARPGAGAPPTGAHPPPVDASAPAPTTDPSSTPSEGGR